MSTFKARDAQEFEGKMGASHCLNQQRPEWEQPDLTAAWTDQITDESTCITHL